MSKAQDMYEKIAGLKEWAASGHEERGAQLENRAAKIRQKGYWRGNHGADGDEMNVPHPFLSIGTKANEKNTKFLKDHAAKVRKETEKEAAVKDWVAAGRGAKGAQEDNIGANLRAKGLIGGTIQNLVDDIKQPHKFIPALTTKRREENEKYFTDKAKATREQLAKKKSND